ncbi:MAG: hypothetical protein KA120_04220 [Candidatus Goldbacteria bacterium]|nr:hypothetical protein [Candidatus Goldiibacteriota bacterium]
MKKNKIFWFLLAAFVIFVIGSCATKKTEEKVIVPDGVTGFLDYRQYPDGKKYGVIFVVSNNYKGEVTLNAQGKSEKMTINPKQIKEFKTELKLKPGNKVSINAGGKTQEITIKYETPQQFTLGFVDTPGKMFNDTTPFIADRSGKGRYISFYHIAKTPEASYEFPGADTLWYAVAFKNKITIKDTDGLIVIKEKPLTPRQIYYVTTYFYDADYNYIGGIQAWEAKYIKGE